MSRGTKRARSPSISPEDRAAIEKCLREDAAPVKRTRRSEGVQLEWDPMMGGSLLHKQADGRQAVASLGEAAFTAEKAAFSPASRGRTEPSGSDARSRNNAILSGMRMASRPNGAQTTRPRAELMERVTGWKQRAEAMYGKPGPAIHRRGKQSCVVKPACRKRTCGPLATPFSPAGVFAGAPRSRLTIDAHKNETEKSLVKLPGRRRLCQRRAVPTLPVPAVEDVAEESRADSVMADSDDDDEGPIRLGNRRREAALQAKTEVYQRDQSSKATLETSCRVKGETKDRTLVGTLTFDPKQCEENPYDYVVNFSFAGSDSNKAAEQIAEIKATLILEENKEVYLAGQKADIAIATRALFARRGSIKKKAMVRIEPSLLQAKLLYVDLVHVSPQYQGKGIAGHILPMFRHLLRSASGEAAFDGTLVLIPANPNGDEGRVYAEKKMSHEHVAMKLLGMYHHCDQYEYCTTGEQELNVMVRSVRDGVQARRDPVMLNLKKQ